MRFLEKNAPGVEVLTRTYLRSLVRTYFMKQGSVLTPLLGRDGDPRLLHCNQKYLPKVKLRTAHLKRPPPKTVLIKAKDPSDAMSHPSRGGWINISKSKGKTLLNIQKTSQVPLLFNIVTRFRPGVIHPIW